MTHPAQQFMSLDLGSHLGNYGATSLSVEGGIGQVWQATGTQLNREVTLKILSDAFATDPNHFAGLEREALVPKKIATE